ncbi:MAG: hypothetical protein ACLU3I_03430 [Acutalibacteraceae bacterium]
MTTKQVVYMLLAMLVAAAVSFASTPMVKALACKVGAIDVPKDNRRMHKVPIPAWAVWRSFWRFYCRFSSLRTSTGRCRAFCSAPS